MIDKLKKDLITTVKVSSSTDYELMQRVIKDGFGAHGKSKWINQTIENFLLKPNFPELVDLATVMDEQDKTISIRLSPDLNLKIEQAVLMIRKEFPMIEGVRSNIIRASILQELLR